MSDEGNIDQKLPIPFPDKIIGPELNLDPLLSYIGDKIRRDENKNIISPRPGTEILEQEDRWILKETDEVNGHQRQLELTKDGRILTVFRRNQDLDQGEPGDWETIVHVMKTEFPDGSSRKWSFSGNAENILEADNNPKQAVNYVNAFVTYIFTHSIDTTK